MDKQPELREKEVESSEYSTQDLFSSSNFTMSSSEGGEELEPSTSGCSSFVAHSQNVKEKKKRVKQYLRELKSMIPNASGQVGGMGTITALQRVLSSLKKKYGKQQLKGRKGLEIPDLATFEYESDSQLSVSSESLKSNDELRVIVSTQDLLISTVSSNLKYILGYPEDSWTGRSINSFIQRRDIIQFSSVHHETEEASDKANGGHSKVFYIRLRKFKGLGSSGFSLRKQDCFLPFQCTLVKKRLDKTEVKKEAEYSSFCEGTSNSEASAAHLDPSDLQEKQPSTRPQKKLYMVLHCVPLVTLYKGVGKVPSVRTFEIRHTLFCSYCHVQPNMIPLLGYLPQEVLGASIFEFYHWDDLAKLYNIYKQVIALKGVPYKGGPIRLRTKNGSWVKVITDWSSFINPWSKQLEFILCKHTVVEAPSNPDVFNENFEVQTVTDLPDAVVEGHQKIKDLLLQPVETTYVGKKESTQPLSSQARTKVKKVDIDDNVMIMTDQNEVQVTSESVTVQSEPEIMCKTQIENVGNGLLFKDSSVNNEYEQLNYSNGIKKFLLSQPRTFSSVSATKTSSSEEEDKKVDETTVSDFDFDISVPKPPSFGSSTKVLASEQEQREDGFTNPPTTSIESQYETTNVPKDLASSVSYTASCCCQEMDTTPTAVTPTTAPIPSNDQVVSLTRESLWKHTLLQERLYIANSSPERSMMFMNNSQEHLLQRQKLKRTYPADGEGGKDRISGSKARRGMEQCPSSSPVALFNPVFPMSRISDLRLNPSRTQQSSGQDLSKFPVSRVDLNMMTPIQIVPIMPVSQSGVTYTSASTTTTSGQINMVRDSGNTAGGIQWPYYPVTGVSLNPHVMVGFNQDGVLQAVQTTSGAFTPLTIIQPGISHVNMPGSCRKKQDKEKGRNSEIESKEISSSNESSMEETSSSLYFLETGSNTVMEINNTNLQNLTRQMYGRTWLRPAPWLENSCFTPAIEMRYHLPKVKKQTQLKKDCEEMKRLNQTDMVFDQFNELMDSLENDTSPFFDEEADYLWFADEEEEMEQTECQCSQINNCNQWKSHDHGITRAIPKLRQNLKKEKRKPITPSLDQSDFSIDMDSSESCYLSKWKNSPAISSENGSQKHDTSSSNDERPDSLNSTITPSDQRSNNENGSSMKESDGDAMSKQSDNSSKENNTSSESESETKGTNCDTSFKKLFVTLSVCFLHLHKDVPPWLKQTDFSPKVSVEYRMKQQDTRKTLHEDMCKLMDFCQPELVEAQLKALLEDIDQPVQDKTESPATEMEVDSPVEDLVENTLDEPESLPDIECRSNVADGSGYASVIDSRVSGNPQLNSESFEKLFCDL